MASGKRHTQIAITSAPLIAATSFYLGYGWRESLVYGALNLAAQTILTPDLDIRCMWSRCWGGLFWPYQKALSHRSFYSHGPVVGTLGRIFYVAVLAWLLSVVGVLGVDVVQMQPLNFSAAMTWLDGFLGAHCPNLTRTQLMTGFAAMECGSMLHVSADYISTALKRQHWFEGAHYK